MIIIISQIVFGLSIMGILVIILRKIPIILRYPRRPFEEVSFAQGFYNFWRKITEHRFFNETALPKTEKTLRRIKIGVLKIDNFLARLVDRLRHKRNKQDGQDENNGNIEMPS